MILRQEENKSTINDNSVSTLHLMNNIPVQERSKNLRFYRNEIKSQPNGDYIDNIHKNWFGDYKLLERHHGYIQWLFPNTSDSGMNGYSQKLSQYEIKMIRNEPQIKEKIILSYKLMLNFYGIDLINENDGTVKRAPHWKEREFNFTSHNNLRITRILKSIGELGFPHYRKPLIEFYIQEILVNDNLDSSFKSLMDYWIETLDSNEKDQINDYIRKNKLVENYKARNKIKLEKRLSNIRQTQLLKQSALNKEKDVNNGVNVTKKSILSPLKDFIQQRRINKSTFKFFEC